MSKTYVPSELRRLVHERAKDRCEYCQAYSDELLFAFQVDHVISEVHGGPTILENLALACRKCNAYKGPNLSSVDVNEERSEIVHLFNPRAQVWREHFGVTRDGLIIGRTKVGRATLRLLRMNDAVRVERRNLMVGLGYYRDHIDE